MSLVKQLRVIHACMITTIGFVSLSFIMSYTSPIEDALLEKGIFTINTYVIFGSALNMGGLVGSLLAGPISEWLGIKTSLILFSQLGTLGGMLLVLAHDGVSMIAARFILGFYTSMCQSCVPVYNAEVAPVSMKKFYGGVIGLAIRVGMLLSYTLGIWIGYRWLAVIYMVLVVFMNLNLVFLPESPKWLRNKGQKVGAGKANEYFYDFPRESIPHITNESGTESEINSEHEISVCDTILSENSILIESASLSHNTTPLPNSYVTLNASISEKISSYFIWPVIRPLLVCCSLQFFKTFSGHQYLLAYTAHTLDNAVNINPKVAALFYPVSQITGAILFIWIIHKVHWKTMLLITTFAQVLVNAVMSITFYLSIHVLSCSSTKNNICDILQFLPMPLIGLYGFTFSMGWGSIGWWVYGQLLHPHYTRISAGLNTFIFILASILNQLIGPLIAEYLESYTLFLVYAVLCLIGFIVQLFY